MPILVINSGSTSIKYALFGDDETEIKQGEVADIQDHYAALKLVLRQIGDLRDLKAVGHRVVHGGDKLTQSVIITDAVLSEIEKFNRLAPLHNPYNLAAVKALREYLPEIKQVAVFDTAFYSALPQAARLYALPLKLSEKHEIKRFGFHGISHKYVMEEAAKILKKPVEKINLITCHLGGGWSVTAIESGKPVDTSMGWTPLEGLVMMTRSGDLDPSIVLELIKEAEGETTEEKCQWVYNFLNHESGIKGLSGATDYKQLIHLVSMGNTNAKLAFNIAIYRLVKYIGAYSAVLNGKVEAIVFTGAVGSGNPITRDQVMAKLNFLKKVKFLSIPTNEELMIAREVKQIINNAK